MVRSLWAALGVVWVMELLLGWDVDRLVVCWPVSWDVVVAVDIGTWNLLGRWMEDPTAKTADRLVAARVWKSPWLVTLLEAYNGRLAIEATVEPSVTVSRNQGSEIRDEWRASIGLMGMPRGVPRRKIEEEKKEIEKRTYRFSIGADVVRHWCLPWSAWVRMLVPVPASPAHGPPTDWGELVQVHDARAIFQASPDELPVVASTVCDGIPCHGADGPRVEQVEGGLQTTRKIRP